MLDRIDDKARKNDDIVRKQDAQVSYILASWKTSGVTFLSGGVP